MSSFWWGQSALDELIEKATSELLPAGQVDLALHLEISDQIRGKKVNPKDAMKSLKQRLGHKNPNVILATLSLVDTCMKNSGSSFVKEVATREFMEEMTHLIKIPTGCNQDVKQKVLYLIQVWGIASKGNTSLSYISGTYSLLRAEGYIFPPITERIDSILLETAIAPEWTDSDFCERCRTSFTLTNRKHHCRQCGATFCQQCSSKNIALPHLGINEIVRVCDGCYIKVKLSKVADKDAVPNLLGTTASISSSLTPTYTPSIKNRAAETFTTTTTTNTSDDQFEDDLKKAIEMSLKESEKTVYYKKKEPVISKKSAEEEEEENLAAAIAASLQDLEISYKSFEYNSDELSSIDMENIQLFSTLMQRIRSVGGDVSGDKQINKLYTQIGSLQPKLVKTLDETSQKHDNFVALHGKLNNAVKAYDKLLEERVSKSAQRPYYSYPQQQQQQQQQQHSYPQNYNQQSPVVVTPVNPIPSSTNTLYQPPYSQHSYVATSTATPAQPQSYIATTPTPAQHQPYATPVISAQQPSYPGISTQQQQTYSVTPDQQQIPAQNQPYATTPIQHQSYVASQPYTSSTGVPNQTFPVVTPVQQYSTQYSPVTAVQPTTEYQSYQYPSVPTTAPSSDYYTNSYYSSSPQVQQKQPVEEAPLIEL